MPSWKPVAVQVCLRLHSEGASLQYKSRTAKARAKNSTVRRVDSAYAVHNGRWMVLNQSYHEFKYVSTRLLALLSWSGKKARVDVERQILPGRGAMNRPASLLSWASRYDHTNR